MLQRLTTLVAKARSSAEKPFILEFLRFGSSTAFVQVSRVASGLAVAALVDPAAWGNWYLLNLIIAYGSLTQLGALNGMNREVPAALGRDDDAEARELRRSALGLVLLTTGVATLLLLGAGLAVPAIGLSDEFLLTIALLFSSQIYAYATTSLRSTTHFTDLARLQFVQAVIFPALAITGAVFWGIPGFILGQILALAIASLAASGARNVIWQPKLDRLRSRHLITVGFPIMLVGLVHTLFATVDRWVVAGNLGSEALGHYSLAIMALNAVALLPQVISQQFYPRIAFAWSANRDAGDLRRLAARQRLFTFVAVVPVVVLGVLLAPTIVRAFLPQYTPGIPAIIVTMFVPLVSTIGQGYGGILHVLGRQTWYLGALLVAALVNLGVSLILIGSLGLAGVAVGTLVAFAVLAGLRVALGGLALRRVQT